MAEYLKVSLDSLVGHTGLKLEEKMIQRIQEVTKMSPQNKEHVFAMLDAFIRQTKMQNVFQ